MCATTGRSNHYVNVTVATVTYSSNMYYYGRLQQLCCQWERHVDHEVLQQELQEDSVPTRLYVP